MHPSATIQKRQVAVGPIIMASAKGLRKSIRKAITAITNEESKREDARQEIDSRSCLRTIFADFVAKKKGKSNVGDHADNELVTPLIIACDQKCSIALKFFCDQLNAASNAASNVKTQDAEEISKEQLVEAWGHPNDASLNGNQAIHHLMAVGFHEGIEMLYRIQTCVENVSAGGYLVRFLSLLETTNENGDTPIMMACAFGHSRTVQYIVERAIKFALLDTLAEFGRVPNDFEDGVVCAWDLLKTCFDMKNRGGQTAFNLACGHGRVDIVELLIEQVLIRLDSRNGQYHISLVRTCATGDFEGDASDFQNFKMRPLAQLSHSDFDFCETTVNNIIVGKRQIQRNNQCARIDEFELQYDHAYKCLSLVRSELERLSDEAARELCLDDAHITSQASNNLEKAKSKHKKKKRKKKNHGIEVDNSLGKKSDDCQNERTTCEHDISGTEPVRVFDLDDRIENPHRSIDCSLESKSNNGSISPTPQSAECILLPIPSAKCLRKRLCDVIDSQSFSKQNAGLRSHLDNIFESFWSGTSDRINLDMTTYHRAPLIVACKEKCSEALIYLLQQIREGSRTSRNNSSIFSKEQLIDAWGCPTDKTIGGNQASHEVMAAGYCEGIFLLEQIRESLEEDNPTDSTEKKSSLLSTNSRTDSPNIAASTRLERFVELFEPNNDCKTPIMLACAMGHSESVQSFVECIIQLCLKENLPNHVGVKEKVVSVWNNTIKNIFGLKDGDGLTAFNVACARGHVEVVKLLIEQVHVRVISKDSDTFSVSLVLTADESNHQRESNDDASCVLFAKMSPLVQLSYSDLKLCQTSMGAIVDTVATLKAIVSEKNLVDKEKELESQYLRTHECFCLVGEELTRISNEAAKELWYDESSSSSRVKTKVGKSQKKKKQRKTALNQTPINFVNPIKVSGSVIDADKAESKSQNENFDIVEYDADECPSVTEIEHTMLDHTDSSTTSLHNDDYIPAPPSSLAKTRIVIDDFEHKSDGVGKRDYAWAAGHDQSIAPIDSFDTLNVPKREQNQSITSTKPKSLLRILRNTSLSDSKNHEDVVALMESLCLDPIMLLYSPHEMAIGMSPCQLDVIEGILRHQLSATKEARDIHTRLLQK